MIGHNIILLFSRHPWLDNEILSLTPGAVIAQDEHQRIIVDADFLHVFQEDDHQLDSRGSVLLVILTVHRHFFISEVFIKQQGDDAALRDDKT